MNSETYNNKVLYVDDEINLLSSFRSLMRKENLLIYLLEDPAKIDKVLNDDGPFAVVISDQRMPGLTGVKLLQKVQAAHPETIRLLLTGYSDFNDVVEAVNLGGISQYIPKPWEDNALKKLILDTVARYNLKHENAKLLEELRQKNESIKSILDGTLAGITSLLNDILSFINPHAASQTERIKKEGNLVIDSMTELTHKQKWSIMRALELFNIGLAVMPPWIQLALNKEGLSAIRRFSLCRNHHILAANLIDGITGFEEVAGIIRLSKKNFDGSGVPDDVQVSGQDIPVGSRLLKILIDKDMLTTAHLKGVDVLKSIRMQPDSYDKNLIDLLIEKQMPQKELTTRIINIFTFDLKPGMKVLNDIQTKSGIKLFNQNTVLTETSLTAINSWGKLEGIVEPITVEVKVDPDKN